MTIPAVHTQQEHVSTSLIAIEGEREKEKTYCHEAKSHDRQCSTHKPVVSFSPPVSPLM